MSSDARYVSTASQPCVFTAPVFSPRVFGGDLRGLCVFIGVSSRAGMARPSKFSGAAWKIFEKIGKFEHRRRGAPIAERGRTTPAAGQTPSPEQPAAGSAEAHFGRCGQHVGRHSPPEEISPEAVALGEGIKSGAVYPAAPPV